MGQQAIDVPNMTSRDAHIFGGVVGELLGSMLPAAPVSLNEWLSFAHQLSVWSARESRQADQQKLRLIFHDGCGRLAFSI